MWNKKQNEGWRQSHSLITSDESRTGRSMYISDNNYDCLNGAKQLEAWRATYPRNVALTRQKIQILYIGLLVTSFMFWCFRAPSYPHKIWFHRDWKPDFQLVVMDRQLLNSTLIQILIFVSSYSKHLPLIMPSFSPSGHLFLRHSISHVTMLNGHTNIHLSLCGVFSNLQWCEANSNNQLRGLGELEGPRLEL